MREKICETDCRKRQNTKLSTHKVKTSGMKAGDGRALHGDTPDCIIMHFWKFRNTRLTPRKNAAKS